MSEKTKQKKQETTSIQSSYNDDWNVVSQKKQKDKENSVLSTSTKEVTGSSLTNKNVSALNKISKSSNINQDSISTQDDKGSEKQGDGSTIEKKKMSENSINTNQSNQMNDTSSVHSKSEDINNQLQITPTDKFNQFRERLNEQTKRYYYFDKQFFKIYNCQQINGLDSNQILKLKDENSQIYQDLRNIILSYINYNGGIIFFGFNHIKRDNSPHMEVNGFDITKNDKKKYELLQKTLEIIFQRITPKQFKYDLSIMKVRKDKNQEKFTQEKYVARIIVQQGSELRTLYVYKDPNSSEQITAKYSKKDFKFITIKGTGLTQAQEQKKQLTKVKDLIFTHIDDFLDPQSSYANLKKTKMYSDPKKSQDQDGDQSFCDSKSRSDEEISQENDDDPEEEGFKSNYSDHSYNSETNNSQTNGWNETSKAQPIQTKEGQNKFQDTNTNKENSETATFNYDVGQWNTELIPDKTVQQKGKKKTDSTNFLQNQQDEETFPNINLFGKNSSSQIDQGDSQSNSSIAQQDQSTPQINGTKSQQEQQNIFYTTNFQQNNSTAATTAASNSQILIDQNQAILGSNTPNSQTAYAAYYQKQIYQQQQQQLQQQQLQQQQQQQQQQFQQQHQQQKTFQNHIINFQQQQIMSNQVQNQHQQQQQQPVMKAGNQTFVVSPFNGSFPTSQSSTPIPYQPSPQLTSYNTNIDCKLSNSLKGLTDQQLYELINHLEVQVKNYQDYLSLAKQEENKRKYEYIYLQNNNNMIFQNIHHQQQCLNQNPLNMHTFSLAQNGSAYSNPHSNSSLAN
ncbi:hypothetical protein ABPG72_009798 [Tetrahymena utriculariae]